MRQGTGIKQGELMAKISLAHVFPLFNKYFLRAPLHARHCFSHLGYISEQKGRNPCSLVGFPLPKETVNNRPNKWII